MEVLRQAIDPILIQRLLAQTDAWFQEAYSCIRAGSQSWVFHQALVQSGLPLSPSTAYISHLPGGAWDFLSALRPLWQPGMFALLEACSVRRQSPEERHKAFRWHQDAFVIDATGQCEGYVYWIPLTDVNPETHPTLEVATEHDKLIEHVRNPQNNYVEADAEPEGERVLVQTSQGDVVRFPLNMPHRTAISATASLARYSVDLRVVNRVPEGYAGWAVQLY